MELDTEDDLEKLEFYMNATFDFFDSILFSSIITIPSKAYLNDLKNDMDYYEIEKFYNHIHLTAITTDPKRQREYACKFG